MISKGKVNKVAFFNAKGGCTKTTSIVCEAGVLSMRKNKVLVIDLDKQCNTTYTLLNQTEIEDSYPTVYDYFTGACELQDVVIKATFADRANKDPIYKNIDVIPGDKRLEEQDSLSGVDIKEDLAKFIEEEGYDWVLVDMPPSNKVINNICFRQIVDFLIIPFSCDIYSFLGYSDLMEDINMAREENPDLHILGIFLARIMESSRADKFIKSQMGVLGELYIDNAIPHSAEIKDVPLDGPISFFCTKYVNKWVSEAQLQTLKERGELEEILKSEKGRFKANKEKPSYQVKVMNPSLAAFERLANIMENRIEQIRSEE